MKKPRLIITILAIANFVAVIVYFIAFVVSLDAKSNVLYWAIPAIIFSLINGFVLLLIGNLSNRLSLIEEALDKKSGKNKAVGLKPKKDYIHNDKVNNLFSVGESVMLTNFITIDGYTFKRGAPGTIVDVLDTGSYLVKFDEQPGNKYLVKEGDLKSISAELNRQKHYSKSQQKR